MLPKITLVVLFTVTLKENRGVKEPLTSTFVRAQQPLLIVAHETGVIIAHETGVIIA